MNSICLNGKILPADKPALMIDNKSYRYGDGLFETIKVIRKKMLLETYHFERFFSGLTTLRFQLPHLFAAQKLKENILLLCEKNNCDSLARVRLSAFRGNGGIYDGPADLQYTIESWPVDESVNRWNEKGLIIDVYPEAKKSCDKFSAIKSANYLPYIMASQHAKDNKWDDCLVVNMYDRIADGTIANIFLIKDQKIITPPLSEGCVNGVMRRYLIEQQEVEETVLTVEDILSADELFFTNAIYGIRWIEQFREKKYTNLNTRAIYNQIIQAIFR